jgi:hypothetical protein
LIFNIDLVVCEKGQGTPIMNAFMYADFAGMANVEQLPGRIGFELDPVDNKVEFYKSLKFSFSDKGTMFRLHKNGKFEPKSP